MKIVTLILCVGWINASWFPIREYHFYRVLFLKRNRVKKFKNCEVTNIRKWNIEILFEYRNCQGIRYFASLLQSYLYINGCVIVCSCLIPQSFCYILWCDMNIVFTSMGIVGILDKVLNMMCYVICYFNCIWLIKFNLIECNQSVMHITFCKRSWSVVF